MRLLPMRIFTETIPRVGNKRDLDGKEPYEEKR